MVSALNALIKDQVKKLERFLNVCVIQSVTTVDGENKLSQYLKMHENARKCSLLFGHPEVFVDNRNVAKMLKERHFQESIQAVVIDEAHLVLQWYV